MRLSAGRRPYDLYMVILLSTSLLLSILLLPDMPLPRMVLGLPFLLLFPGYVLISALYPDRKRYFDDDGRRLSDDEARERRTSEEEDDGGHIADGSDAIGSKGVNGKGLDQLERIALSLGLSLAVTPLIGLLLNWTYDWDPSHMGIREWLVVSSMYAFNLITASIAAYRRYRVPLDERFIMEISIPSPKGLSATALALSMGIAVMLVLSASLLVYMIVVPRPGESFTEFYVLGPDGKAEGYPSLLQVDEVRTINIGIANHERTDIDYILVLTISRTASNVTVASMDNVTVSSSEQPSMLIHVKKGRSVQLPCNFSVSDIGLHRLRLLLFKDGEEHRDLQLWIRVFDEPYLRVDRSSGFEAFLAGGGGDPGRLVGRIPSNDALTVTIGIFNPGPKIRSVNVTFRTDEASDWQRIVPGGNGIRLGSGRGGYIEVSVDRSSTYISEDILLIPPEGNSVLDVELKSDSSAMEFHHPIEVGGSI